MQLTPGYAGRVEIEPSRGISRELYILYVLSDLRAESFSFVVVFDRENPFNRTALGAFERYQSSFATGKANVWKILIS